MRKEKRTRQIRLKIELTKKRKAKVFFLIFNMILATIAFSYLIGVVDAADNDQAKAGTALSFLDIFSRMASTSQKSSTPNPTSGPGTSSSPLIAGAATTNPVDGGQIKSLPQSVTPGNKGVEFLDWFGGGKGLTDANNLFGYNVMSKMSPDDKAILYSAARGGASPQQLLSSIQRNIYNNPKYKAELDANLAGPFGSFAKQSMTNAAAKAAEMSAGIPGTVNPVPTDPNVPVQPNAIGNPALIQAPITESPTVGGAISNYFGDIMGNVIPLSMGAGAGLMIGLFAGGKNGWMYGALAGGAGMFTYQILSRMLINAPYGGLLSVLGGLGVAAAIFLFTYKKENTEIVEFSCLPWQAPIGGQDCERYNNLGLEISEYNCKSLGQACMLINKGETNQSCFWKNPYDTNSPTIEMNEVTKGHKFIPDKTIRPPATGVEITLIGEKCIKAFTPLKFSFNTSEPAQCKIDYNLTSDSKTAFDSMGYYVGGTQEFGYLHSETLSLPGPDAMNKASPELHNDGTYTLYIRCQDANGNVNVNPFSVRFCVDPGPDNTSPVIVNISIPSGSPIQFNRTSVLVEVYVNEPADCKWSKEDRDYDNMEYNMSCNHQLWEMNNEETYTCIANLTGIENRKENLFYFRCMDKPDYPRNERNPTKQSYLYKIIGTQPLNILKIEPDSVARGASDMITVNLTIKTDNGYNNGKAICYYSNTGTESSYIQFSETGENLHKQRQDLIPGNYHYYFKCVDLGGNTVYNSSNFSVESDKEMPYVIRVDKESGELRMVTDKESICSFSNQNCNFEIDNGIMFSSVNKISHFGEWRTGKNYYVRCKDKNNNQPDPNICTIVLRPVDLFSKTNSFITF